MCSGRTPRFHRRTMRARRHDRANKTLHLTTCPLRSLLWPPMPRFGVLASASRPRTVTWPAMARRQPRCRAWHTSSRGYWIARPDPDPTLWGIAKRLGTGPQQVIFRFAMQIGMLPLTGTTSEQHMKEDLQVESLELTPEETRRIEMMAV